MDEYSWKPCGRKVTDATGEIEWVRRCHAVAIAKKDKEIEDLKKVNQEARERILELEKTSSLKILERMKRRISEIRDDLRQTECMDEG